MLRSPCPTSSLRFFRENDMHEGLRLCQVALMLLFVYLPLMAGQIRPPLEWKRFAELVILRNVSTSQPLDEHSRI